MFFVLFLFFLCFFSFFVFAFVFLLLFLSLNEISWRYIHPSDSKEIMLFLNGVTEFSLKNMIFVNKFNFTVKPHDKLIILREFLTRHKISEYLILFLPINVIPLDTEFFNCKLIGLKFFFQKYHT